MEPCGTPCSVFVQLLNRYLFVKREKTTKNNNNNNPRSKNSLSDLNMD